MTTTQRSPAKHLTTGIDPRNPWMRAATLRQHEQTKAQAAQDFASQLLTTRLNLWAMRQDEDATDIIAQLVVVIGTPCEAGAQTFGREAPWVRQLHGALRTLQTMCLAGYRWQETAAPALDRALDLAAVDHAAITPETFTKAWKEANGLAAIVLAHQVSKESIA